MMYIEKHPFYENIYVEKEGNLIFKKDEYGNLKELKIYKHKPYYRKKVTIEGKSKYVHHVVYETYHEEKWDRSVYDIDHIDQNAWNNSASNLRKLTKSVNRGRGDMTPEEYIEQKKQRTKEREEMIKEAKERFNPSSPEELMVAYFKIWRERQVK